MNILNNKELEAVVGGAAAVEYGQIGLALGNAASGGKLFEALSNL